LQSLANIFHHVTLGIFPQRKSSELDDDITCVWKGIERNHLEETILNIAQKSEPDLNETLCQTESSLIKMVLRQIIKKLTTVKEVSVDLFFVML
jgi:hypothetical protein